MFRWLKRKWMGGRVGRWASRVAEYHSKSITNDRGGYYRDEHIRVAKIGQNISVELVDGANLKLVYAAYGYYDLTVTRFNPGCWVKHLKSLLPDAEAGQLREFSAFCQQENAKWSPVDDCKKFNETTQAPHSP